MTPSCFIHVLTKVRTHHLHTHIMCICIWYMQIILFQISFCITRSTIQASWVAVSPWEVASREVSFVVGRHSSGSNRWIVFTKVRALSCGQWVSQLHGHFEFFFFSAGKIAEIFQKFKKNESSDPSSFFKKFLEMFAVFVFLLPWNLKNSWNRSIFLFLWQNFCQTGEFQHPQKKYLICLMVSWCWHTRHMERSHSFSSSVFRSNMQPFEKTQ